MKKKISFVLAFLMAASIMAGCKKTEENTDGLPDVTTPPVSLTQMTTEETTTTTATETTAEETAAAETEESETETTTASETTSATTATAATATAASKDWNETEISETLYIKTSCYSRTRAIVGSDSVKKYSAGTRIEVVAATDTGYYKLADGTFIHSDYVTDQAPAAETTAKKVTTTKATENDGDIIEDETTAKVSTGTSSIDGKHPKSFKDRYPYQQLSSKEQELYQAIVEAAYDFKDMIDVPQGLDSDQIYRVYSMVYDNEPQLFWLSRTMPSALGGMLIINYAHSKSDAEKYQAAIDKNRTEIMKSVNGYTSTISRLKVIYDWVIRNNVADATAGADASTIINGIGGYGVLQCQGYAKSVLYLCDYAGIDCMTVPGKNPEGTSHAWNIVYCDNGYYIVDATWGDPQQDWGNASYTKYLFFLANDEMTKNSHLSKATMTRSNGTVVKIFDPPACTKTSCYYFKAYNKEYSDLASATQAMYDEIDAAIKENRNVVHIRVTDKAIYDKLMSTDMWSTFRKYAREKSSNVDNFRQQPTFTEDLLVVDYDIIYK